MKPKYKIHKEGREIILTSAVIVLALNLLIRYFSVGGSDFVLTFSILSIFILLFIISFFRIPFRILNFSDSHIIAPADGKVVVIEEVEENEYFKDKRLQVSIFMSPANVHVNRHPISGVIDYVKYHPGKYLVAWHPKSSSKNEHNSVVIKNHNLEILVKQIAGTLARRIVSYIDEGDRVEQNSELGFIKFGSRVDLFLPLDTEINVKLKQKVKGGVTIIGSLPD